MLASKPTLGVEDLMEDSERGAWAAHHGENRFARYRRVDESESSLKRSKSLTIKNQVLHQN
jgi:hypothetical protein